MNPTLMNLYPVNYAHPGELKYTGRERPYDYMDRANSLSTGLLDQQMGLGSSTNMDFKYSSQSHQDGSCNTTNSQPILTPPQSGDEASLSASNPSSSSFTYPTLTKASSGNASGIDYYHPATTSSFLSSTFNGTNMTQTDRRSGSLLMPPLSPPYNFGNSYPPYSMNRPTMTEYHPFSPQRNNPYDPFRGQRAAVPLGPFTSSMPPFPQSMTQHANARPEGPPFESTRKLASLTNSLHQSVDCDILASITKGFFRVEDKWTCYRRNYFSVACGFTWKSHTPDGQIFLHRHGRAESVVGYAVSISAVTAAANTTDSETRGLVQHTPKRDKATESVPGRHMISPTPAQGLNNAHNIPQSSLFPTSHIGGCMANNLDAYGQAGSQPHPIQHIFDRIQFQKATANNGKRRAQQQYFHVVVQLEASLGIRNGKEDWVLIATKKSHQMVVRGRSPGHYKDNRRDSQTSMEPDGGHGHGHENSGTGYAVHPMGPSHTSSHGGGHNSYRHGHHYGTSFPQSSYRMEESGSSTTSPGSSVTLSSSPAKGEDNHANYGVALQPLPDLNCERIVLSPILCKSDSDLVEYHHSKRQAREEDNPGHFFQSSLDTTTYSSPSFDFSATPSQALCT